jgi:hypothetical protein
MPQRKASDILTQMSIGCEDSREYSIQVIGISIIKLIIVRRLNDGCSIIRRDGAIVVAACRCRTRMCNHRHDCVSQTIVLVHIIESTPPLVRYAMVDLNSFLRSFNLATIAGIAKVEFSTIACIF